MPASADEGYVRRVEAERHRRISRLTQPEGWLSLVGLDWLHDGVNSVGADPDSDVVLRGTDAPEQMGEVIVDDRGVRFVRAPRADVTLDGELIDEVELQDDEAESGPTTLAVGSLRIHLIRRGGLAALRIRDHAAETLQRFSGIDYFPIDPAWHLVARFEPTPGVTVAVPDVIGLIVDEPSPGVVVLSVDGVEHRLLALEGPAGGLWLVFGDATNGVQTYDGGRFLHTDVPRADRGVIVDFNLAYNPPCVFTPYATCPLPPTGNRLPLAIEAGERGYAAQVH
jgi:uncharacterized protein (DUF1684 family)